LFGSAGLVSLLEQAADRFVDAKMFECVAQVQDAEAGVDGWHVTAMYRQKRVLRSGLWHHVAHVFCGP
jgi:hypothetical protein